MKGKSDVKMSIITPTEERPNHLNQLYKLLKSQTFSNWEWLIYDTSLRAIHFPDERIHYYHNSCEIISVGEKRNRLIENASGQIILHCDDDDYYAPHYLKYVAEELNHFDFFNIHSWLSYQSLTQQFYYWDTEQDSPTRFILDPLMYSNVREYQFGPSQTKRLNQMGTQGYGFSYAYWKEVWMKNPFPDKDLGEDQIFYKKVQGNGGRIRSIADHNGLVVHIIHTSNISRIYPQYLIPSFFLKPIIPHFFSFLEEMISHEN